MMNIQNKQWHRTPLYLQRPGLFALFVFGVLHLVACSPRDEPPPQQETLVVRVGDRTISVNEFIRRAEYTIRPVYCRGDYPVHKKIILNSLIAEKLFALEEGDDSPILRHEEMQLYLQGRKEQAMRQWFYYKEAYEPVKLDTGEVRRVYRVAGRKYRIGYYSFSDSARAGEIAARLRDGSMAFEDLLRVADSLESVPERIVEFDKPEHDRVHEALYSRPLQKGEIVGPLHIDDKHLVIKVLGWTESLALTDQQIRRRWQDVSERLKSRYAEQRYLHIVADLMRGKRVEFAPQTFRRLVAVVAPSYIRTHEMKKQAFNEHFWGARQAREELEKLGDGIEPLLDEPLFRFDGEIWTVRDLETEMKRHPLVFRKRRIPAGDFAEQFKLAIVDMLQDRVVTDEAYRRGYDRVPEVQRYVQMWKDNVLFLYHQQRLLEKLGLRDAFRANSVEVIESHLNAYVDSLLQRYRDRIEINVEAFENIQLTRVDMFVMQRNVPFPIVVPAFPAVTTRHRLDYGRRMAN